MDECWRCASKLIAGSRFCPGCGAAIGSGSGANPVASKPIEREPADPLAATAPADASMLAALRRGHVPAKKDKSDEAPKTKGRTVPMKATDLPPGRAVVATPAPATTPAATAPAPRRAVAKTQADEPTMPSHGEQPRTSPKASSTFGDPVPPPQPQPPPKQPQAFQAYVPPAQPVQPAYVPPAYGAPAPAPYAPPPAPYAPPPAPPAAPAVGAKVLVEWPDGNRYPATVQQCAPGQCLVLFPDGQQRWVDVRRVTPA
jgi:hypothetical protein